MESRRLVVWISAGILGFQGGTLALDLINCTVLSWLWVERHGLEQVSRHQGGRSARVAPAVPDPSGVQEPAGAGEQVQPGEGEQRASASPNPQPRLRELGHPRWIRWACSASGPTAEFTMLLLLGLLVHPGVMVQMLPLGIVLGLLLELLVRPLVVLGLGGAPRGQRVERLLISAGGLRGAVPLALSLALLEQVPRLREVHPLEAAHLATQMEALVAVAVITSLVLKGVVLPRLLQRLVSPEPPPVEAA